MNTEISARSYRQTSHDGFTIVELLIVIVVIGILAAITIVAYNGVQDRARATALTTGFKKIDKAFRLMAVDQDRSTWWIDNSASLTGVSNPLIDDIITATTLKNYLQRSPDTANQAGAFWWYDNDNDTYDPTECLSATNGVNIVFTGVAQNIALQVDKSLDDGNLSCGKIRVNVSGGVNRIFYSLSDTQQIQ
jgi:prepilin-type N-terminal cleavage/methylation domain-containing protein